MIHYDGRKSVATAHMSDSDNLKFREKTFLNFKAFLFRKEKSNNVLFFNKTIVGFNGIFKNGNSFFSFLRFINRLLQKKQCFYNPQTFTFTMPCDIKLIYLNATCGRHMIKSWYSSHGEFNMSLRENKVEHTYHITFTTNFCKKKYD